MTTLPHTAAETKKVGGVKTLKMYIIGFILSLILTLLAFALVAFPKFNINVIYAGLLLAALAQLLVQVICFLRLNVHSTQDRWNLLAFLFTVLILSILFFGSLWIMYNLNYNMS